MQLDTLIELLKRKREELGNVTVMVPSELTYPTEKPRPVEEVFQINVGTAKQPRNVLFLAPL